MTERTARAAGVPGGTPDGVSGAMAEFVNELKGFRADIEEKLQAQDKRMTMLDRKTAFRGRSPLSQAAEIEAPHQKAFDAYVRHGDDGALSGDGTNKPKGFLTHARAANATATNCATRGAMCCDGASATLATCVRA